MRLSDFCIYHLPLLTKSRPNIHSFALYKYTQCTIYFISCNSKNQMIHVWFTFSKRFESVENSMYLWISFAHGSYNFRSFQISPFQAKWWILQIAFAQRKDNCNKTNIEQWDSVKTWNMIKTLNVFFRHHFHHNK